MDGYGGVVGCDDLTFMNVSEDEIEESALDISMDSSMDMSPCSTPSSMSPVASWDETALPAVANDEVEWIAWVRKRKVKVESSIEECDWLQAEEVQAEQVEVAEVEVEVAEVVNGEVELRAWQRVKKVKVELARSEAVDWLQVEEIQAEEIEVGKVTRVAEPTVVVSVPNPTFDWAKRVLCEYELDRRYPSVGEPADEVVKGGFDDDIERLFGVGDVLRNLCNTVGYEVEKEQLTGAYEVLEDVCGRVEIVVDVEEVTRELVNHVVDRSRDDEFSERLLSGMVEDIQELVGTVIVVGTVDEPVTEVEAEVDVVELVDLVEFSPWLNDVPVERVCDTWKKGNVVQPVTENQRSVLKRMREVFVGTEVKHIPSLKNKDRRLVNDEVELINGLIHNVLTKDITEVNRLIYSGAFVIAERLGMIKNRKGGARKVPKEPWWKRRIEGNIKKWRKDLGLVDAFMRGNLKNVKEKARLEQVYGLRENGTRYVIDVLKGKIHAGGCKVQNHLKRNLQFHQNNLFRNDQKQLYKELSGSVQADSVAPNKDEATDFWGGIWSNPVTHNRNAEWIEETKRKNRRIQRQEDVVIEVGEVKAGIRRMTNWKAPGPDGVQGFWFKKFTNVHGAIADGLRDCLARGEVPEWMTEGRTSLFMKDLAKGPVADNYRPIACLPMMWKLLTGIFSEKIYDHLDGNKLLPDEQKGCRKRSRGTKDQLLIDKMILQDAKRGRKNLSMGWIDYKKAYDMVPHSWLIEVIDLLGVAGNVASLLASSMMRWKTQLIGGGDVLGTVDIKRGIFQGDSLSPLLFVMVMIPLSQRLNAMNEGYKLVNEDRSINHLLFMDDLKLYARSDEQLQELVGVVKAYSDDIKMEFGLSKCAALSVVGGKVKPSDGLVLPSGEVMKEVDEDGYKYLGVLQRDSLMYTEMKEKVRTEYFRRLGRLLKSELYAGNLIAGINAWAIGIVRYTAGVLNWGATELKKLDVKTRKIMTLHGAFHRNSDVDRLYMKRKDGGRGLISLVDCVRIEEENLLEYVTKSSEWMLQKVVDHGIVPGTVTTVDYKKRKDQERKDRFMAKPLHGRFLKAAKEDAEGNAIAGPRSWEWVRSMFQHVF